MAKMRVAQIPAARAPFEIVERDIPDPGPGYVRIKVQACGICHSDTISKEGSLPGLPFPQVPGHEVVGVIDAVGAGVEQWTPGRRVGVGWNGGYCKYCDACRRGDFFGCRTETRITGITNDGGYAEYLLARSEAVAAVPDGLTAEEAAPLMCAGLTTFNALRNSGARSGDLVAVLGLGGLGHLGVQFAAKMGFRTVAIARGKDKEELARKLGAHDYIDSQTRNPGEALAAMGGASIVLATVTNGDAMSATLDGIGLRGSLMILGAPPSLEVQPFTLIRGARSIRGWYSGTSIDSEDTLKFCVLHGVRSMNESYPLASVSEAYDRMQSGKARFRVVLTMGQ